MLESIKLKGTTDASGDVTINGEKSIFGRLYAILWDQGNFDNTCDATFSYTDEEGNSRTLLTLTNVSADGVYYPREKVHTNVGAAATGEVFDLPVIAGKPKLVIAQGGNAKTGAAILIFEPGQRP